MDFKELKKKGETELHKLLSESRNELRELRFKDANKQLKNVRQIRTLRTHIANILTLLNGKRQDGAKAETVQASTSENKE